MERGNLTNGHNYRASSKLFVCFRSDEHRFFFFFFSTNLISRESYYGFQLANDERETELMIFGNCKGQMKGGGFY